MKLQSAMEYLISYGWMLIILGIAIVTIFELGFFNTQGITGPVCTIQDGWSCVHYIMNTNGIVELTLQQTTGNPITVTSIACYQSTSYINKIVQVPNVKMNSGSQQNFLTQCYTSSNAIFEKNIGGQYYSGYMTVYYTDNLDGIAETTSGTIAITPSTAGSLGTLSYYIPIQLSNQQSTGISANFQQMISFNPSLSQYSQYEASNLSNIEFTSGAPAGLPGSTPMYAWLESGASTSATNTVAWVNLGSSTLGAAGSGSNTLTIYMNFMPNSAPVTSGYTGYAPQLWCASGCFQSTYGQYDNGGSVFSNYWNFAGASVPNGWQTSTAGLVDNGLTLKNSEWAQTTSTNYGINSQQIIDYYADTPYITSCGWFGFGYYTVSSGNGLTWGDDACTGWHTTFPLVTGPNAPEYSGDQVAGGIPSGNYLLSVYWGSGGKNEFYYNYIPYASDSNSLSLPTVTTGLGSIWNDGNAIIVDYLRVRSYPPNGVMPGFGFGSVG